MWSKGKLPFALTILFLILVWSSAYTAIRIGLGSFSPESLALLRFSVATLVLYTYAATTKKASLPKPEDVPILLMCGFLGISLYHIALNRGQMSVTAGSASMLLDTYPVFVAIFSSIILKEYINLNRWIGILVSFAGIALIAIGENTGMGLSPGVFLIIIAAISLSIFDVIQKKLMKKYTPLELTMYFFGAGTLFLMFFSGSLIKDLKSASHLSILAVTYLGIVPGAISYLIWSKLISKYSVTNLSTILFLVPPFAILIAFFYLNEIPTIYSLIGGTIALIGVVIVNLSDKFKVVLPRNTNILKRSYELITRRLD
ncbi:MAG: hypothetical protein ACD_20C00089G0009 [uncultured bacterium]|nr:MAG: hypothetical protein ACD_20C00089G0009 [uncultured bacterium]